MLSRWIPFPNAFLSGERSAPRSAPAWLQDAIDAAFVAGVLLTLALVAL
jgi:hypothetical protein